MASVCLTGKPEAAPPATAVTTWAITSDFWGATEGEPTTDAVTTGA